MNEQDLDFPCPICSATGQVKMITHIDEIPYFGEHTQLTLMCNACGWTQTDFIPAEGKKAGSWTLIVSSTEHISARVVRSSSCTVRIAELGLEVTPGSSSTGYISNVEGVLDRFASAIGTIRRQADVENDEVTKTKCDELLSKIDMVKSGELVVTLELLDPVGHSQILHEEAVSSEISDEDAKELDPGPIYPVFDVSNE